MYTAPRLAVLLLLPCLAAASKCAYGSLPGAWKHAAWTAIPQRGPQEGRNYHRLDETGRSLHLEGSVEPEGAPFGSAWESLGMNEPGACALANLLAPFWSPTFVARRTVLLLGDSNDFHILNFLCSEYARRGFPDWHAYVYSHDAMNWCALPSGLTVLQLCLTGVLSGDVVHVHHAASFFGGAEKGFRGEGMGAEDEALRASQAKAIAALGPPDTVVLAASFFTLHQFADSLRDAAGMTPTLLPRTELELLASRMGALGRAARAAFPAARLAFRTTHELWTVCDTGLHVEQPYPGMWGKRSWVAAINAALRHAAAAAGAEVVDLALMAEPFTPRMTTTDNLHYKAWLGLELLNVELNLNRSS